VGPHRMKLWLVSAIDEHPTWEPWYDKLFGVVVRAGNERIARNLAFKESGAEPQEAWLDPHQTTCVELRPTGETGVILKDERWA